VNFTTDNILSTRFLMLSYCKFGQYGIIFSFLVTIFENCKYDIGKPTCCLCFLSTFSSENVILLINCSDGCKISIENFNLMDAKLVFP
jgi:hypothetical protein